MLVDWLCQTLANFAVNQFLRKPYDNNTYPVGRNPGFSETRIGTKGQFSFENARAAQLAEDDDVWRGVCWLRIHAIHVEPRTARNGRDEVGGA